MENNFSFKRIGLMLKADWIEYKKSFFLLVVLVVALNLFLLKGISNGTQIFVFFVSLFCTLTFFYVYLGWKVHRSKNRFLTLPASGLEKFVEILLVGLIYLCTLILIHTLVLGISYLINNTQIWFIRESFSNGSIFAFSGLLIGVILFVCTFLFMCCIMIRKYPLPLGTLFLILYGIGFYILAFFVLLKMATPIDYIGNFTYSNAIIETFLFLYTYSPWVTYIASAVFLCVSFLKFKEMEIK